MAASRKLRIDSFRSAIERQKETLWWRGYPAPHTSVITAGGGPMTVAERFYSINYFKSERLVELTWLPGTQEMTDQDFKEALCVFAEGALQHRAKRLIIDMRQFMSQPSAEVGVWRDEVIVPKYEKAGVKKIAWVWPDMSRDEMGTGADYQQRYFATRDEAINWCVAPN
jgi:hypothetical protein